MYSLTRIWIDSHEAAMHKGIRKAVSTTKGKLMPSTPIL